jgi:hypothetical protein
MGKPKTKKDATAFGRFENFAKALISVPRKELQAKLEEYERHKKHKKRHALKSQKSA